MRWEARGRDLSPGTGSDGIPGLSFGNEAFLPSFFQYGLSLLVDFSFNRRRLIRKRRRLALNRRRLADDQPQLPAGRRCAEVGAYRRPAISFVPLADRPGPFRPCCFAPPTCRPHTPAGRAMAVCPVRSDTSRVSCRRRAAAARGAHAGAASDVGGLGHVRREHEPRGRRGCVAAAEGGGLGRDAHGGGGGGHTVRCANSAPSWTRFPPMAKGTTVPTVLPYAGLLTFLPSPKTSGTELRQTIFHTQNRPGDDSGHPLSSGVDLCRDSTGEGGAPQLRKGFVAAGMRPVRGAGGAGSVGPGDRLGL